MASSADQRLGSYRFVIAGMLALLSASFGLSMFAVTQVMPLIIDDYSINRGSASLFTSVVPLVHIVLALPCSLLVGRVRPKNLITLACFFASTPLLSLFATNYYILLSLRMVYGMSLAVMFPATAPLLMQRFRPTELPLINGLFIASFSGGVAISSFTMVPVSEAIGWKTALSLFGGVTLVGGFFWHVVAKEQRSFNQVVHHLSIKSAWSLLRSRTTMLLASADAGPYALYTVSFAWLPTFYHEVHGVSLSKAGSLMGILSVAGVVSLVLASLLTLRVQQRRPFLIFPGVLAGFAGLGSFLLADTAGVYIAVIALGFVSWFYLPALLTIPMEMPEIDETQVAVIFGTLMSVGSIFTFLAPLVVGVSTDLLDTYIPGLALFSVLAWSLAIAGFLLPETGVMRQQRNVNSI